MRTRCWWPLILYCFNLVKAAVNLTHKNYDNVIQNNPVVILFFLIAQSNSSFLEMYRDFDKKIEESKLCECDGGIIKFPNVRIYLHGEHREFNQLLTVENLQQFVQTANVITEEVMQGITSGKKTGVILLYSNSTQNIQGLQQEFNKLLTAPSNNYLCTQANIDLYPGLLLAQYAGIEDVELPALFVLQMRGKFVRYKYNGEFVEAGMKAFIEDYKHGIIQRFMLSEGEFKDNAGPVFKTSANNFKRDVIENDDDVLVMFYSPGCLTCERLEVVYKFMATNLRNSTKLKFYKINIDKNEIDDVAINDAIVIQFYKATDKRNVTNFYGDWKVDELRKFIIEQSTHSLNISSEKEPPRKEDL
eukprot:TRINITY_DN5758_c0_g2_i1.p1 TRINITY_DN5758_c0_g2~~TRINITY_DN5758_c0_g2_i1.p1  ORF type:complete len:360 (-),score=25.41 TRINITY_DN5758_c0_g2_i1:88-1167(-)